MEGYSPRELVFHMQQLFCLFCSFFLLTSSVLDNVSINSPISQVGSPFFSQAAARWIDIQVQQDLLWLSRHPSKAAGYQP